MRALLYAALLVLIQTTFGFYISSTVKSYRRGEQVPLYVDKVFSERTLLPYAYKDLKFTCPVSPRDFALNLGEALSGDRIAESTIAVEVNAEPTCKVLCQVTVPPEVAAKAALLIKQQYQIEWLLDDLPGATPVVAADDKRKTLSAGFRLGQYDDQTGKAYLNTHFVLQISYIKAPVQSNGPEDENESILIYSFEVYPKSYRGDCLINDHSLDPGKQEIGAQSIDITYTYSVRWKEVAGVSWSDRWALYFMKSDAQIHWFSILNSIIVMMLLSAMVAFIMLRTLRRDINTYNEEEAKDEQGESTGWKLISGDVFRTPKMSWLLASFVGSGMQILAMAGVTLGLSLIGLLSPSYKGGFLSLSVFTFAFAGVFGGYCNARLSKVFQEGSWVRNACLSATIVPGIVYTLVFILNLFLWYDGSTSALPFGTFLALGMLWFGISLPLTLIGAYFGHRQPRIEYRTRTNQIPRQIPEQPWYLNLGVCLLAGGLLPFGVVFIELFFIFKSIWQDQYYYFYGFLTLVGLIYIITCIEITIVIIYFSLCSEDYKWWWKSFWIPVSSCIYVLIYALLYLNKLQLIGFLPNFVYIVRTLTVVIVGGALIGSVGFAATFYFLRRIYAAIKLD